MVQEWSALKDEKLFRRFIILLTTNSMLGLGEVNFMKYF